MRREDLLDLNEAVQHPGKKLAIEVTTELQQEEDLDLLEPVVGQVDAVSTGNLLLLEGRFRAMLVIECARCGAPLHVEVNYRMDDQFPVEGIPSCYGSGCYAEVVPDEPFPLFVKNSIIKDNWVRQGLIVNLPVQALCKYGWDGPCPNALRLKQVQSGADEGHTAFQALKGLVVDDGDDQ